jgi:hypothetical protein
MATRFLVAADERGEVVRGEAASFDEAYDMALSMGGSLYVVPMIGTGAGKPPRVGSVEYVEAVQS